MIARRTSHGWLKAKLESIASLTDDEKAELDGLRLTVRDLDARTDIVRDGEIATACCMLLAGWAIRYKLLPDGRRSILSFHVPGDVPDLQSIHLEQLDHTLATLTSATVAFIPHDELRALNARRPRIAGILWRQTLIDAAMFREWIVNVGQRDTLSRTAHLFCEMEARLAAVDLSDGGALDLPISQVELADAFGISAVHMNRTIQDLRARGLVAGRGKSLVVQGWRELRALAGFDPAYLHIRDKTES